LFVVCMYNIQVESLQDPSVPSTFFPFGADEGDSVVRRDLDVSSPAIRISSGFRYISGTQRTVFVSVDTTVFHVRERH